MDVSQSRVDPSLLVVDLCFRVHSHSTEDGAVRSFTGAVLLMDEDGEKDSQIGWLNGHLVHTGRSDFVLDADGESGDLVKVVEAVCDDDGIRHEVVELPTSDLILHLDSISLERAYRGQDLGLTAVRRVIDGLGMGCAVVALNPNPIEGDEADRPVGQEKLQRHWSRLGFKPVPGHPDIYYIDLTEDWQEEED